MNKLSNSTLQCPWHIQDEYFKVDFSWKRLNTILKFSKCTHSYYRRTLQLALSTILFAGRCLWKIRVSSYTVTVEQYCPVIPTLLRHIIDNLFGFDICHKMRHKAIRWIQPLQRIQHYSAILSQIVFCCLFLTWKRSQANVCSSLEISFHISHKRFQECG